MADESGKLVGIIGDEDTVLGFLLAGIGHRNAEGDNYLVVKPDTDVAVIDEYFKKLTSRSDVGIVLINQPVANLIRGTLAEYNKVIPTVLEIPSKETPYDPTKDSIMARVAMVLGSQG